MRTLSAKRIPEVLLCALFAGLIGCQARTPGTLETAAARTIKRSITVGGKKDKNPLLPTEENIHAGRENFAQYCFACHGLDGQNTGVPFAEKMSPPVPLLTSPAVQEYTDGQLKWVIQHGLFPSGMPASKDILNDDEIWQTVLYIRNLPLKGSLGEPRAYSGLSSQEQSTIPAQNISTGLRSSAPRAEQVKH